MEEKKYWEGGEKQGMTRGAEIETDEREKLTYLIVLLSSLYQP